MRRRGQLGIIGAGWSRVIPQNLRCPSSLSHYYEGDPKGPIENVPKLLLSISRIHFEILRKDEKTYIVGRSENGTFVRGEKLQKDQPRPLKHGDVVAVVDPDNNLFMYLHEASILSMNFPTKIKTSYLIGKEVGRGSYGDVYLAYSRIDLEPVALKVIKRDSQEYKQLGVNIKPREARIQRMLKNPYVLPLKEYVEDRHYSVLVMEFAKGKLISFS